MGITDSLVESCVSYHYGTGKHFLATLESCLHVAANKDSLSLFVTYNLPHPSPISGVWTTRHLQDHRLFNHSYKQVFTMFSEVGLPVPPANGVANRSYCSARYLYTVIVDVIVWNSTTADVKHFPAAFLGTTNSG